MGTSDAPQKRADGFNWAWRNGASVISNSWRSSTFSELLEDAIQSAMTNGRNGLGCVVTFLQVIMIRIPWAILRDRCPILSSSER